MCEEKGTSRCIMILIPWVKLEMNFQIHDPLRTNELMYSAHHNSPMSKLFHDEAVRHGSMATSDCDQVCC